VDNNDSKKPAYTCALKALLGNGRGQGPGGTAGPPAARGSLWTDP